MLVEDRCLISDSLKFVRARAGELVRAGSGTLEELLDARGAEYVEYPGWQAIDGVERAAGEPLGRPRVKLVSWDQLLHTSRRATPSG